MNITPKIRSEEDTKITLTPEEQITYNNKLTQIQNEHPDRMTTCEPTKQAVISFLNEAKTKGYNILPAPNPKDQMQGFIVHKDIEGIELAYNPQYPSSEGIITEYEYGYFQPNNPS